MTRLQDHIAKSTETKTELLLDMVEGDSVDTEVADDNDAPPGVDPRTGDPRSDR